MLYLLDNRDDPEVDASIKSFLRAQYQSPKAEAPRVADGLELTAKVEKKYYAAQVVEYGLQVCTGMVAHCRALLLVIRLRCRRLISFALHELDAFPVNLTHHSLSGWSWHATNTCS